MVTVCVCSVGSCILLIRPRSSTPITPHYRGSHTCTQTWRNTTHHWSVPSHQERWTHTLKENLHTFFCLWRTIMSCVCVSQVLYFPDRWWHATLNLDTSVFISTFLGWTQTVIISTIQQDPIKTPHSVTSYQEDQSEFFTEWHHFLSTNQSSSFSDTGSIRSPYLVPS